MNHGSITHHSLLRWCALASVCVHEIEKYIFPQGVSLKGWFACWLALVKGLSDMLWCGSVLPVVWLAHWINVVLQMKEVTREWYEFYEKKVANIEHDLWIGYVCKLLSIWNSGQVSSTQFFLDSVWSPHSAANRKLSSICSLLCISASFTSPPQFFVFLCH